MCKCYTHEHILEELTSIRSYCCVFDTLVEDMPEGSFPNRPWDKGNNPKTAVWEFLKGNNKFKIDEMVENKLLITVASNGYLKRIK